MLKKSALAIVCLTGILAGGLSVVAARSSSAAPTAYGRHVITVRGQAIRVSDNAAFGLKAFGMRFSPDSTTQPTVSLNQAVSNALTMGGAPTDDGGHLLPNVYVAAEYGSQQPDGMFKPRFQNVPAWIVTFTGSGVNIYSAGPVSPSGAEPVNHEVSIIVDARTGGRVRRWPYGHPLP
jgi:hypothetical protein